ncbi:MAG: type II secretion system F family protein [Candidatus Bathyarchaeia archaeon]
MKTSKVLEKIERFCTRFKMLFEGHISEKSAAKTSKSQKVEFYSMAYKFIGGKTERFLPLFKDLDLNLQKSGIRVSFKAYVSLTVFTAILLLVAALAIIPSILFLGFGVPLMPSFMFGIGGGLFACAFSIIGFYIYPVYRADKVKRDLEDELPFTTGYMAILSSAGVSPEKIFYSLSNLTPPLAMTSEAKNIVRNINLFGLDVISALEETSRLTPSEKFREMLEGFISTIHSGGNLAHYLREKSTQYMKLKRISLRKFSDTLSILSEFYVALLVTGPLLLVIMLAVMSMLGGGLGALDPDILLNILTYIGIPLGSIMFLIILDAVSPKW